MKKWIIGIVAVVVLALILIYTAIPNQITLQSSEGVNAGGSAIHRTLLDKKIVKGWWPGKITDDNLYYQDLHYEINRGNITVMPVSIRKGNIHANTSLFLTSVLTDSTQLHWVGSLPTSYNPVTRAAAYFQAKKISKSMGVILKKMKQFYAVRDNIYGIKIKKTLVVDSLLIVTSAECTGYPTNEFIYGLVGKLQDYAARNAAKQTGYPMLNVSTADSTTYQVKVAIPTNKLLPSSKDIVQRTMPGRNVILFTQVKGGNGVATSALEQIANYANDHQLKTPAIPFFSLVTDRRKEADTSKWITDIYYPVMIYPELFPEGAPKF
jgi:hypothetical protein